MFLFFFCLLFNSRSENTILQVKRGHSKKLTFSFFAYSKWTFRFSTHRSFSLWSTRYPDELVSKEATSEAAILKLSWQLGCIYVMSFRPTRNWREREKPATDLASFTRSAKSIFFSKRLSISLSSKLAFRSLEQVWLKSSHSQ